jgi:hypothetical protein
MRRMRNREAQCGLGNESLTSRLHTALVRASVYRALRSIILWECVRAHWHHVSVVPGVGSGQVRRNGR